MAIIGSVLLLSTINAVVAKYFDDDSCDPEPNAKTYLRRHRYGKLTQRESERLIEILAELEQ